ncbi:MAG TPA: hypothetical protein VGL18_13325 [Actinomycetota bacterium]
MNRPVAVVGLVALLTLTVCTDRSSPIAPSRHPGNTNTSAAKGGTAATGLRLCPVTRPNGATPPGEVKSGLNHGNGMLWRVLWPRGVVVAAGDQVLPDGSVEMKFPWWRGVKGRLSIEGHRLDGLAPPLRAVISDYGLTGFQASGIIFPTPGGWEVTGRVRAAASLTFVTLVVAR